MAEAYGGLGLYSLLYLLLQWYWLHAEFIDGLIFFCIAAMVALIVAGICIAEIRRAGKDDE